MITMNLENRNRLTDFQNKLMVAGGRIWGRYGLGVWDGYVHTVIFKTNNQQGPTVSHMELCSMFCGSLDGSRVWGRMDTCICMDEYFGCSPETILLIGYVPIENKKKM